MGPKELATVLEKQISLEDDVRFLQVVCCCSFLALAILTPLIWCRHNLYNWILQKFYRLPPGTVEGLEEGHPLNKDHIEYIHEIGSGANGWVFLALQTINGKQKQVAHKKIRVHDEMDAERLLKLLDKLGSLSSQSPFMLAIMHYKYVNSPVGREHVSLSTEYCSEGTLQDLAIQGKFSDIRALNCGIQVLKALEFLHNNGIVHRDIKGENILLTKNGNYDCIKLGDVDLAAMLQNPNSKKCGLSYEVGTTLFMAPEVLVGSATDQHVGRSSDIWSFGCMMVQLASYGQIRYLRRKCGMVISTNPKLLKGNPGIEIANGAVPKIGLVGHIFLRDILSELLEPCWRMAPPEYGHNSAQYRPSASNLLSRFTCTIETRNGKFWAERHFLELGTLLDPGSVYRTLRKTAILNRGSCHWTPFIEELRTVLRNSDKSFSKVSKKERKQTAHLKINITKNGTEQDLYYTVCITAIFLPFSVQLSANKVLETIQGHSGQNSSTVLFCCLVEANDPVTSKDSFFDYLDFFRAGLDSPLRPEPFLCEIGISRFSYMDPVEKRIDPDLYRALELLCGKQSVNDFLKADRDVDRKLISKMFDL